MSPGAAYYPSSRKEDFPYNMNSNGLHNLTKDFIEETKNELLSEIKHSIEKMLHKKTLDVMMMCKEKAAKCIEADRLKKTPGWFESLSRDVTQDEYQRYLGVTIPSDSEKPERQTRPNEPKGAPKVTTSNQPPRNLPSFFDLLNGSVTDFPPKDKDPEPVKEKYNTPVYINVARFSFSTTEQDKEPSSADKTPLKPSPTYHSLVWASGVKEKKSQELDKIRSELSKSCVAMTRLRCMMKKTDETDELETIKSSYFSVLKLCLEETFSAATECPELQSAMDSFNEKGSHHLLYALDSFANLLTKSISLVSYKQHMLKKLAIIPCHPVFKNYSQQFSKILFLTLFSFCPYILPSNEKSELHKPPKVLEYGSPTGPNLELKLVNIFAFYCQIILENHESTNDIFTVSSAWNWLSSFSLSKSSATNANCLFVMIEILGTKLISIYQDQAIKLFRSLLCQIQKAPQTLEAQKLKASLNSILAAPHLKPTQA